MCCQPAIFLYLWESQEYNFGESECKYLIPKGEFSTLESLSFLTTGPTKSPALPNHTEVSDGPSEGLEFSQSLAAGSVHVASWWALPGEGVGCQASHTHLQSLEFVILFTASQGFLGFDCYDEDSTTESKLGRKGFT